jgi:hypothetical protein
MKMLRSNTGDRTSPEFERETDFFIPMDVFLLKIEDCSEVKESDSSRQEWDIEILITTRSPLAASLRDLR